MPKNKPITISFLNKAFEGLDPRPIGQYNYSSVLIPLIEKDGELHILYEVRAETLRSQPGEISFPGGKMEEGEIPLECAIRETSEEIGIPMDTIDIITELNYINSYSNFTMYSFLGQIAPEVIDNAKINEAEVKEIFTVPLQFFVDNDPYIYTYDLRPDVKDDFPYREYGIEENYPWRKGTATVPFYTYRSRVIWGLTARLTLDLSRMIREKLTPQYSVL